VYVNPQHVSFEDLAKSLHQLNRFPALIIFEGHSPEKDTNVLLMIEAAIKTCGLTGDVGIYFRHDKSSDIQNFNHAIAERGYNKNLGDSTIIAGISNNKLPKFMIKNHWKPKTVISFTNSFRSNKSSVYCSDVDLVVYHTNTQPLDKEVHALL
jgi:hypothetical protein